MNTESVGLKNRPRNLRVVVWLPLPASSGWRGEGIVQTVENILSHAPTGDDAPQVELVISPAHAQLVHEAVREHPNVVVKPLPFLTRSDSNRAHSAQRIKDVLVRPTLLERLLVAYGQRWTSPLQPGLFRYGIVLSTYVALQRMGLLFRKRVFWFPAPIVPLTTSLRGTRVFSFWDPFIFEYSEYYRWGRLLFPAFLKNFAKADKIITQSYYNKRYLSQALDVPHEKIEVIINGSPDYSRYRLPRSSKNKPKAECIVEAFGSSKFRGHLPRATRRFIDESLSRAVLLRLAAKLEGCASTRVIFVSTQYRPHKGLYEFLEVARRLVQDPDDSLRYQFIFTAKLPEDLKSEFPELREQLHELHRLSNRDHALIYQLADLVVHPSHSEGGSIPYPLFEAASLGVPCIINRGRHTDEAILSFPDLEVALFEIANPQLAKERIRHVLHDGLTRERILSAAKSAWRDWEPVSRDYFSAFAKACQ